MAEARRAYGERQFARQQLQATREAVAAVLTDNVLSPAEERHVMGVVEALGLSLDDLVERDRALYEDLVVARINDGRPPVVDSALPGLKAGEVAHGVFRAALMKEQLVKEYRGGSSGVSIPLGNFQALLVRALAVAGEGVAAARQAAACRELFRRELGVEPGPALAAATATLRAPSNCRSANGHTPSWSRTSMRSPGASPA